MADARHRSTRDVTKDADKKPAPKRKPSSHLKDVIDAMGITGFDEKKDGWAGMLKLLRYVTLRAVAAEAVCQSIAVNAPSDKTLEYLKGWAMLLKPSEQNKLSGVDADVAEAANQ